MTLQLRSRTCVSLGVLVAVSILSTTHAFDARAAGSPGLSLFNIEKAAAIRSFAKFTDELPIPARLQPQGNNVDVNMELDQFSSELGGALAPAVHWGYNGTSPGPTIEVERGQKIFVHWKNALPTTHIVAKPQGADGMCGNNCAAIPDVRNVTHLHGAAVTQESITDKQKNNDGWPDAWTVPGEEQLAEYPNDQSARTLWYHDHASAATGRNVASGLVGMYIIHDDYERSLNLPSGKYEVPLIFQTLGLNADASLYYTDSLAVEFYGNAVATNGKLWPYINVEPRKYRFRILNASNARTYAIKITDAGGHDVQSPIIYQIGSDGGFLENTAIFNDPANPEGSRLNLAPAERADVIIDFSQFAGREFYFHNNSLDGRDAEIPIPLLLKFRVGTTVTEPDTSSLPMHMQAIPRLDPNSVTQTRQIVMNQMDMPDGTPMLLLNNMSWSDPITEKPALNTTEIWDLVNATGDIHPFHIHLVTFQVISRTPFDLDRYTSTGDLQFTGMPQPPEPNEMGWKDTIKSYPGMVTKIIMRFEPFPGFYVYHCHILEHEDMDMMRPFQVVDPKAK